MTRPHGKDDMDDTAAEISALKERLGKRLCVMGHHYQHDSVVAHCDITGDSLELARRVADVAAEHIVFCGVHFMGESAALLTRPDQAVHLPNPDADCLMSRMAPAALVRRVLERIAATGRRALPLAYVNTSMALKAVVGEYGGSVCTSANAKAMLAWALDRADSVLFLPDRHLGGNVATALGLPPEQRHVLRVGSAGLVAPETQPLGRRLLLWPGCCAIHARLEPDAVDEARRTHPGCRVVAHPECREALIRACDGAGSTSYLIKEAARVAATAPGATLVIGTENNLVRRLARQYENRCRIVPLGHAICGNMAQVTAPRLRDTLRAVAAGTARPLEIDDALRAPARLALTRMLDACA